MTKTKVRVPETIKDNLKDVLGNIPLDDNEVITVGKDFEKINLFSTIAIDDVEIYRDFANEIILGLSKTLDLMYSIYSMTEYGFTLKYEGEV